MKYAKRVSKAELLRHAVKSAHEVGEQFPVHRQPHVEQAIARALEAERAVQPARCSPPHFDVFCRR